MKRGKAMNIINCCCDCIYQKDGYCNLKRMTYKNERSIDGCVYYKKDNRNYKGGKILDNRQDGVSI